MIKYNIIINIRDAGIKATCSAIISLSNATYDQASYDLTGTSGFDLREPSYTSEVNSMRNTMSNVSAAVSSFNNAYGRAVNKYHNDQFHGDSKFIGSTNYSSNSRGGGGISFSFDCELI